MKRSIARDLLLSGKSIPEVCLLTGLKERNVCYHRSVLKKQLNTGFDLSGNRLTEEQRRLLEKATELGYRRNKPSDACLEAAAESCRNRSGAKHPRWILDRSKLAKKSERRTTADVTWSRAVRRRFPKCVLQGGSYGECCGRLESHHIEPLIERPELRFVVENGVTLCQCHHPRGRTKVEQLKSVLKSIVQEQNNL